MHSKVKREHEIMVRHSWVTTRIVKFQMIYDGRNYIAVSLLLIVASGICPLLIVELSQMHSYLLLLTFNLVSRFPEHKVRSKKLSLRYNWNAV
jgi:hypothetical protein